ncbi:SusC/RagA family TonB-linked outer membrane protein [Sphingobacterium spiritivorum]|uniref:SusC/RagA family TonB-linked outer membrane protein n=1 Tax=Sphingobacterium spiritivorum TaxID=258 RepID=UPI003DA69C7F
MKINQLPKALGHRKDCSYLVPAMERTGHYIYQYRIVIMKLKLFVLFACIAIGQSKAAVFAQKFTLHERKVPLKVVFDKIEKSSNYVFFYDRKEVEEIGRINVNAIGMPLDQLLSTLAKDNGFTYKIVKNNIAIKKSDKPRRQETIPISGIVRDSTGIIQGVSVQVKNKPTIATSTDVNGRFILMVPPDAVLTISMIGYKRQEIQINKQTAFDIFLEKDDAQLDEVVVIGFGTQKKQSLVSSVATVKGEELKGSNRSLSNSLAGKLPGLIAVQRSGEPGYDNSEFWIRGTSSFSGGTSPLILVDGIPRTMNDIEPDEIETFTLLKDAAATAVYGAEGANGVVLITSKRGIAQKTTIAYRGEYTTLRPTRIPKFASSADYLSIYNEGLMNEGKSAMFSDELIAKYRSGEDPDLYPNSQWWDLLMKENTNNTRHTLSFRGGGDRMKFFVSGAYFGESGLYKVSNDYNNNAGIKRYNLRSNIDLDVTKTTSLRVDLSGQYLQGNYPYNSATNIFERFSRIPPYLFPAKYSDGTLAGHPAQDANKVNPYNQLMEYGYRKEWRSFIQSRVDLNQKLDFLTEGLKVRGTISYDSEGFFNMSRYKAPKTFYATGRDDNGKLIFKQISNETTIGEPQETSSGLKKIYMEAAINYDRLFGNKHQVNGMLLTYQKEQQSNSDALAVRKQAYIGRGVYTFDNRYAIEANFGITGSEKFAEGYRYGFFPAVGIAYNISNEPFFGNELKKVINNLKVRASIGKTGNDDTGGARFLYRPTFSDAADNGYSWGIGSTGTLNKINGIVEGRFASPSLSWEIEIKRNYGIDLGFFNNSITLQVDYFDNRRSNILMQRRTISGVAGFRQAPFQNFGVVTNKGIEGGMNINHTFGEFKIGALSNFTFARNKIIEMDEIPQLHPWMNTTGTRINALNGMWISDGLYRENDFNVTLGTDGKKQYSLKDGIPTATTMPSPLPGDLKFKDLNGDGIVNEFDRSQDVANPIVPEIIYGFGLNLQYKGIYASVFFQGANNVSTNLNNQGNAFLPFQWGLTESNVRQEILESRWTEQNPSDNVFFPRVRVENLGNTNTATTWWVRDASFLRLKNVEIGYTLPKSLIERLKFRNTRLYIMGQNLYVWDKVKMYDPELGNSAAGTKYPLPRTWTFGLEITL